MKFVLSIMALLLLAGTPDSGYDDLPINRVQVIGSHNSYKRAIDPVLFDLVRKNDSATARALQYSHIPLTDQLGLGLRNIEIDVYADSKGGKYAHPKGLDWEGKANQPEPFDPAGEMKQPGFKVFHVQEIDFRSNCPTFAGCLKELREWSDRHPDHYPVYITMNAKDEKIDKPDFTVPEPFTAAVFDALDKVILDSLGRDRLLLPDDIRGSYPSLEQAVLAGNWPTMRAARGKFVFILDEKGTKRDLYIQGHPSLRNRIFFANAEPGTPEAAFLILNDPQKPAEAAAIRKWVKKGYMIRTRADADTEEARRNDKSRFQAACASGAQIITTDYYYKSSFFPSDYTIHFEDGGYIRKDALQP